MLNDLWLVEVLKTNLNFALQEKGGEENHQLTTDIFGFRGIDAVHTNFAKINFRTRRRKDQCAKKGLVVVTKGKTTLALSRSSHVLVKCYGKRTHCEAEHGKE